MTESKPLTSPILWQNEEQTVTLLDIPRSISVAQGTAESPCDDFLICTKAQEQPFPSQEPKTEKAKANLRNNTVDELLNAEYEEYLQKALNDIRKQYDRDWCLPRQTSTATGPHAAGTKRKLDELNSEQLLDSGIEADENYHAEYAQSSTTKADSENRVCGTCYNGDDRFNTNCDLLTLHGHKLSNASETFRFPPRSSFYLGNTTKSSRAFHAAIRNQADSHDTRKRFDFVLLDPPWPNRSVKRSTHANGGRGYSTAITLQGVQQLILETDLDMLMAEDCLVGVWVTNRPSFRELVLGEEGIFAQWGIELQEEWIWLKTTIRGEPVSSIASLWRKPYEVLLLGRKRNYGLVNLPTSPLRRVICAVPDFHSRKPCLKELIEPLMAQKGDYRALEVFARHLVAGWWSWGDECIKFNGESHWCSPEKLDCLDKT